MVTDFVLFFVCLWGLVDVKTVSVMEGDSVTLNPDLTEVQAYSLIQWMFGSTRIAEVERFTQTNSTHYGPDERFRDRLQLDHQTGSLTITNTRTTDSGLYKATVISKETSYKHFSLTVYERPSSIQTEANITELHQPCSDHFHCCGFTETAIRLAISALVGVAAVAFIVYDIRSTRSGMNRTGETRYRRQIHGVKSDNQYEMSRIISSTYVC